MSIDTMLAYYQKVVDKNTKAYGNDWRTQQYQEVIDRLRELQSKQELSREDEMYLYCREAIVGAFGKK